MKQSKKWSVNEADLKKVTKNAIIFTAPVIITCLTMFQQGVTNVDAYVATIQVWGIGVLLDFFRKFSAGK